MPAVLNRRESSAVTRQKLIASAIDILRGHGPAAAATGRIAAGAGLKQASAYAPTYLVTGNRKAWVGSGDMLPEGYRWSQAIDEAKSQGLQYLVIVYLIRRLFERQIYV